MPAFNFRLPTRGRVYPWEFEKKGREFRTRVEGQLIFNGVAPMLNAALDGSGVPYLLFPVPRYPCESCRYLT
jgi:hypothetical protein